MSGGLFIFLCLAAGSRVEVIPVHIYAAGPHTLRPLLFAQGLPVAPGWLGPPWRVLSGRAAEDQQIKVYCS